MNWIGNSEKFPQFAVALSNAHIKHLNPRKNKCCRSFTRFHVDTDTFCDGSWAVCVYCSVEWTHFYHGFHWIYKRKWKKKQCLITTRAIHISRLSYWNILFCFHCFKIILRYTRKGYIYSLLLFPPLFFFFFFDEVVYLTKWCT